MALRSSTVTRIVLVLAALGLGLMVIQTGVASWLLDRSPVIAARLAPDDARIAAAAARTVIDDPNKVGAPAVRDQVQTALARDITLPSAIELRAVQFELAEDGGRAARLFELSSAISRRSLPTRLWLIQRSVDRGDVAGALHNFDIALRTSNDAPAILFPVLAGASTDPALVAPIAQMLDRPSDWRVLFLNHAIKEGQTPAAIGNVILRMRDRKAITANHIDQTLIARLVDNRAFDRARRFQAAFHPEFASAALIADPDFSRPEQVFPFGWDLSQRGAAWAARDLIDRRPALSYQALPGGEGPVASQLLTLPVGRYRISVRTAAAATDPSAVPYWTLTCGQRNGAQIALLDQPTVKDAVASADFTVPPGCNGQWLALNLRPSNSASGQAGAVALISVVRRQGA